MQYPSPLSAVSSPVVASTVSGTTESSPPKDTKGGPSEGAGDDTTALAQTLQAGLQDTDDLRAPDLALALAGCINGPELDLGKAGDFSEFITAMPPQAWMDLANLARARDGREITSVLLPLDTISDTVAQGLSSLKQLQSLQVVAPAEGELDLSALRCPSLREIQLVRHEGEALTVLAPQGTRVRSDLRESTLNKSYVRFMDEEGAPVGKPVALQGLIYDRVPTDFMGSRKMPAVEMARGLNLNGQARFTLEGPHGADLDDAPSIVCRHLVVDWLASREEHHSEKGAQDDDKAPRPSESSTPRPRYSYGRVRDTKSIETHVSVKTDELSHRLETGPVHAFFEAHRFGALLAREFQRMQTAGSSRAWFYVRTNNLESEDHALALELSIKRREGHGMSAGSDCVVSLYDPNSTATHQRLVESDPQRLQARKLAQWIGDKSEAAYFPQDSAHICTLYAWPPSAVTDKTPAPLLELSAQGLASEVFFGLAVDSKSPHALKAALGAMPAPALIKLGTPPNPCWFDRQAASCSHERVMAFVGTVLARTGLTMDQRAGLLLTSTEDQDLKDSVGPRPFGAIMAAGNAPLAKDFAATVLAPDLVLDSDMRAAILLGLDGKSSALHHAMVQGHGEAIRAYVGAIAGASSPTLSDEHKVALLLGANPHIASEEPAAYRVAAEPAQSPAETALQHQALFTWANAVAKASGMDIKSRASVCAAVDDDGVSAAKAAIKKGNPKAAAALACAILEAGLNLSDTGVLMDALQVPVDTVLGALVRTPDSGEPWRTRLRTALLQEIGPASGQDSREADTKTGPRRSPPR